GRARQLVFGVDDLGGAALRTRQRLELVFPGGAFAEIDAAQELGQPGARGRERFAALLEQPRRDAPLRVQRRALVGIAGHARQDLRHERILVIGGLHDPLERVAAYAVEQRELLLLRARHAHDPLAVAQLAADVAGLDELEVGAGGLVGGELDRARALQ